MKIRNNQELEQALLPALKIATNYVIESIGEKNQELIQKIIYDSYNPKQYERTYEFKEAWREETNLSMSRNKIESKFSYDTNSFHTFGNMRHNTTTYLAEIIYEGLSGNFEQGYAKDDPKFKNQQWASKRDVWHELEKWLGKNKINELFEEGMKKAGLRFKFNNSITAKRDN